MTSLTRPIVWRLLLATGATAAMAAGVTISGVASQKGASLPAPTFAGGTRAITLTPVVGTPRQKYAEMFMPGEEKLTDGELRVTVLGSGNPWVTRAQASASILVEVGNAQRDLLVFDLGSGGAGQLCQSEVAGQQAR